MNETREAKSATAREGFLLITLLVLAVITMIVVAISSYNYRVVKSYDAETMNSFNQICDNNDGIKRVRLTANTLTVICNNQLRVELDELPPK